MSLVIKNSEGLDPGQQSIHKYLIERCRKNDRRAQNELYKLYVQAMYNICRRMMGNEEDARDVLQESFIHAFQNLDKLKETALFSAWIKRIVINHCINALKKKKLDLDPLEDHREFATTEDQDEDIIQQGMEKVVRALDHISEGCKTVLNLYAFEGYDHAEIAQILSITPSASKAQYSKAKAKLRTVLSQQA